jgi:proline-specific peptidase
MRTIVAFFCTFGLAAPFETASAQLADAEPEWYLRTGDGCQLFVQEFGRGRDTIIALHGGPGHDHSYMVDAFSGIEDRYHVVVYDQRGSLRSPCPDSLISIDKHVEDLDRLRRSLGLQRATLVGHSAGTLLAAKYLNTHPDRVDGVVLLGAVVPRTPTTDEERALMQAGRDSARNFRQRPAVAELIRRHGLDKDPSQLSDKEATAAWRLGFANSNLFNLERWQRMKGGRVYYNARVGALSTMPREYDLIPGIAAHRCPVWVINGDHDYVDWRAERHRRWTANVPNARLAVITNAGHAAWLDEPDQFRRALLRALDSRKECRPR